MSNTKLIDPGGTSCSPFFVFHVAPGTAQRWRASPPTLHFYLESSYFSRTKTSPARQIAYRYDSDNEAMNYTKVYKYMTLESFTMSLCNKTLRFVEPSGWNDKFEQRFYCANYKFPKATGNTPQVFATCVTRAENSEAAWKVYSHGKGLSHLCLQLELDMVSLRRQLRASGFQFEEKAINYKPEHQILSLHKKKGLDYQKYFKSFTANSFLNLLSLKREAYAYEQEVRLFIIPDLSNECRNTCKKAKFIDLPFDWRLAIKKVRFDSNFSDAELLLIQSSCFFVNINPIISNYKFIGNRKPPKGSLNVVFERFDINDMPGTRRITIS